ncbi:MAG: ABC transporter substrate-binding protein [Desulfobacterales bacterium]|nr:MAG: ABC transporter substrate-binding protein [Desulfobacterales bacterium]
MKTKRTLIFILLLCVAFWVPSSDAGQKLTLILDWFPNIDHLPIYVARQQGFFAEEGLEIEIISPSETSDGLKMAASGNVDVAVSYEPQTIIAAARGLDVVVFARLIEHPLTTLLFLKDKGIATPKDLTGKRIGYTVPGLMDVLLDAFARVNAIRDYKAINVGFAIVQSLTAGKVDAVMGPFKTYETVTMAHKGYEVGYFELEKWGIPDYDELIFITSKKTMAKNRAAMAAFRRVVDRAIVQVRQNPQQALTDYFKQVPQADRKTEIDAFKLTLPYYASGQKMDTKRWQEFADFALAHGLIDKKVDVSSLLWKAEN